MHKTKSFEDITDSYFLVGTFPTNEELSITDHHGWSVAHELAHKGHRFMDLEVLTLKDHNGYTVAHEQARAGYVFTSGAILALTDRFGLSVAEVSVQSTQLPLVA